jgi:hypothetical protein
MADHSRRLVLNGPQSKMGMERCSFCYEKIAIKFYMTTHRTEEKEKKEK